MLMQGVCTFETTKGATMHAVNGDEIFLEGWSNALEGTDEFMIILIVMLT